MYDHARQYRCTIIRGKAQKELDDLLPAYANVISEICPCAKSDFKMFFDDSFKRYLPDNATQKTLDNHRTEISGTLFGMYYEDDKIIYASERTLKFLADSDTPAFFKDICYKMKFPNGMNIISKILDYIKNGINVKPYAFILTVMKIAESKGIKLTKAEIGYYILNSLDALSGKAKPSEVLDALILDRRDNKRRAIETSGKASSYDWQHISEQINLLELANLIISYDGGVLLNPRESEAITRFTDSDYRKPDFDVYAYDLADLKIRKQFYTDWSIYFGSLSDNADSFKTDISALVEISEPPLDEKSQNTVELGDEGEKYVFEYEKKRVSDFNFRLANKVIHLGKTKGLGYDIKSVVAEDGEFAEFAKYIEVKSTKRITAPDENNPLWMDTLNLTRTEWVAAQQHKDFYHIYRVYFVRDKIIMFIISDVARKHKDGKVDVVATMYRLDFGNEAVSQIVINGEN
jgi:hypothetical protein